MSSFTPLGALSNNLENHLDRKFLLTTAISYTNGYPHIGHAYEFITADVLARFHRVLGFDTFFLTGSDEHGQKVAASAEKAGRSPKDHCDHYVEAFKSLDEKLNISYSRYIRTTDEDHILTSQLLWKLCANVGDIYLDSYHGWYNEREEAFVSDMDAETSNYLDPTSGLPLKRIQEESYFFKLSSYCDSLIDYIEANEDFIQPEQFRNHILNRLKKEGLKDLSISRTSFQWGIPVPDGFDKRHVMYVWFDALANYLTGVNALNAGSELAKFWPANIQIIGKDIIWFHCVIWPCMLMSAKISLPGCVFSHGFVNAADGKKMSKSLNNTVDPFEILNKFSSDSIRYYFCTAVTYGSDINFSDKNLIAMHNNELADILGNLVHRVLNLCHKYCDSKIPDTVHDPSFGLPFDMESVVTEISVDLKSCSINSAIFRGMDAARATNRFLTEAEPWKMKGVDEIRRAAIVRTVCEAVYAFMHFLAPVTPLAAQTVFDRLHTNPVPLFQLKPTFYNLIPGTEIDVGNILFTKIVEDEVVEVVRPLTVSSANDDPNQTDVSKLEFKVGRIVNAVNHTSSDRLICEEIDVGESALRCVVSGLRPHYTPDNLIGKLVIVLCNIKEAKVAGTVSNGIVLTAVSLDGNKIEIVEPPSTAIIGERIFIDGLTGPPYSAARVKKLKLWESVKSELHVDNNGSFCWRNRLFKTSEGNCSVNSITDSIVC